MIFAYNKAHVGDTLMVIIADDKGTENNCLFSKKRVDRNKSFRFWQWTNDNGK